MVKNFKGRPLSSRLKFSVNGILYAARNEHSFRVHLVATIFVLLVMFWLQPGWLWSALMLLLVGLVLALELINTALESALDGFHPEHAEFVRHAKDCAAGAVLVASVISAIIFVLMLITCLE